MSRVGPYDEPAILFVAERVWLHDIDQGDGVQMVHRLLDLYPGPFDPRAIAFRCAMAEQPSSQFEVAAGEQRFGQGPSEETIDAMQNHLATRLFEVAVRAEDEALVRRLAGAGFASWVDDHTFSTSDRALRQLVSSLVEEGTP